MKRVSDELEQCLGEDCQEFKRAERLQSEVNRFIRAVLEPMGLELTHEKCARCDRRAVRIATSDDAFTGSGLCVPCTRQSLIDMGRKIRRQLDATRCARCGCDLHLPTDNVSEDGLREGSKMDIGTVYVVRPRMAMGAHYSIRARSVDQAWAKFVAQAFHGSTLKPSRGDWHITKKQD
jgi:hypothetical protein